MRKNVSHRIIPKWNVLGVALLYWAMCLLRPSTSVMAAWGEWVHIISISCHGNHIIISPASSFPKEQRRKMNFYPIWFLHCFPSFSSHARRVKECNFCDLSWYELAWLMLWIWNCGKMLRFTPSRTFISAQTLIRAKFTGQTH